MSKKKKLLWIQMGIVLSISIIYLCMQLVDLRKLPNCMIKEKTGLLCPTCGGTRCVKNFLEGNMIASFSYHPIFFLTIIFLLIWNILYIVSTIRSKNMKQRFYPKWYWFLIWGILLMAYTIGRNIF